MEGIKQEGHTRNMFLLRLQQQLWKDYHDIFL